ncbi:hypothetical protein TWF718_002382 [Orbilia javanica]|uniref:J domain-containing protein n=1 Tax=Orbilia javanica TaxID=47235 RepID=A0AAN8MIN1_9PEZI
MDPEVLSYYYVLEVEHDARDVQIKLGFRRQCLKWHPDKNPGASAKRLALCNAMMGKLNDAYKCLRDPDARKLYELKCASLVFTREDDPGNWFRRRFEAERQAREDERRRQRQEERDRNAARHREREAQERRRREAEAEEQLRREAEERERRERAERERKDAEERERAEQERREQERTRREQRERENQRRTREQEQRSQTAGSDTSAPNFTEREWESFFGFLRVLMMLHEATRGNRNPGSGSSSASSSGSTASNSNVPRSPSGSSATPNDVPRFSFGSSAAPNSTPQFSFSSTAPNSNTPRPSYGERTTPTAGATRSSFNSSTTSNGGTPRSSFGEPTASNTSTPRSSFGGSTTASDNGTPRPPFEEASARNSGGSHPSHSDPNPPPETPRPADEQESYPFNARFREYTSSSYRPRTEPEFIRLPTYSSRARWSQAELDALLQLRRDDPWATWDTIAYRLNAVYKNGRNGNAARLKHNRHI